MGHVNCIRCGATPLLFLLDGVLSQDEDRVDEAVEEVLALGCMPSPPNVSPCNSKESLLEVLSALLHVYPQYAAIKSDYDNSLPIHFAASLGSVAIAELVLSKYPQGALCSNVKGKIPLHYAAREGHTAMVDFLLKSAPQTASVATDKGKLAIHFAAGEGHLQIVESLLRHHPKSAALSTSKGKVALHFSSRWGYVEVSRQLLEVFPESIRALDWEGSLPLHDAAREGQVQMAQFLIGRFPEALRVANIRSEIPLFAAVQSQNMELVLVMLQAWPAGGKYVLQNVGEGDDVWPREIVEVLLRGATRSLAGHPLLQRVATPSRVLDYDVPPTQFIGEHNMEEAKLLDWLSDNTVIQPQGLSCFSDETKESHGRSRSPALNLTDKDCQKSRKRKICALSINGDFSQEFLALHAAFRSKVSSIVLRRVLAEHPSDLTQVDSFGRYPLHWAVTNANPLVLAMVLNKNNGLITETTASARDFSGKMPLHIAIEEKASVTLIKCLLEACPRSAVVHNNASDDNHGCLPVEMAIMRRSDTSVIFELIRADPTFLAKQRIGRNLGHATMKRMT